jgi:hypothetical protein
MSDVAVMVLHSVVVDEETVETLVGYEDDGTDDWYEKAWNAVANMVESDPLAAVNNFPSSFVMVE